jgi:DNA-binding NarL/FixJ family response regulator
MNRFTQGADYCSCRTLMEEKMTPETSESTATPPKDASLAQGNAIGPPFDAKAAGKLQKLPSIVPEKSTHKIVRLVVIDNHHLFREGMVQLLVIEGKFVPVSSGYDDAQSLVKHYWPDLIVLGLGAMKEGGIRIAGALRKDFPSIPLLLLDESVRVRHVQDALVIEANGYWTKHAKFEKVAAVMHRIVQGERSFCPEVEKHLKTTATGLRFDPPHAHPEMASLTHKENELFLLFAQGFSSRQCAEKLGISENDADRERAEIMSKLHVREIADFTRLAIKEGLFE